MNVSVLPWSGVVSEGYTPPPHEQRQKPTAQGIAHSPAVAAVEQEIKKLAPNSDILPWIEHDGDGQLEPCHHKAFHRYEIIISSIGAGKWRATMPERMTDGFDRADMIEPFIVALGTWLHGRPPTDESGQRIHQLLGERDGTKSFLASYLHSLLRALQRGARQKAEKRTKED